MPNIDLCFCIPTFNRSKSVHRLVTDILSCGDAGIRVIVLDNGSTDDTLTILHKINDKRFFVHSNGENRGALFNMINVLDRGIGSYLVYSTDQDYINPGKIADFKNFLLSNNNLSCGYCKLSSRTNEDNVVFNSGLDSIKHIAYKCYHPTGYFFKNDELKKLDIVERFSDYSYVDLFPLEFIFAELCSVGSGAIYNGKIFTPETGENVVNHKSSTTNGMSKKAFFSPEARLKLAVNFTDHVNKLNICQKDKNILINNIFISGFFAATKEYRSILNNKKLCVHYRMDSRKVNMLEISRIGFNFYTNYVNSTKNILNNRKLLKFELVYIIILDMVVNKVIRKIKKLRKIFNYLP